MATTAYQTLAEVRFARGDELDAVGRPVRIDSCYAYSEARELVPPPMARVPQARQVALKPRARKRAASRVRT